MLVLVIFVAAAAVLALAYWWAGGFSAEGRSSDRAVRELRRKVHRRVGGFRRDDD